MFPRTGSVACFHLEGRLPEPGSDAFSAALAKERFRGIETSASEQNTIGWVTPADPTGESFAAKDMDADAAWWLRARMDKKKLPPAWVAIHRAVAERSRGRPLSRKELRELKEDLERQLLPRVLPAVRLIDVLYAPKASRLLVFASGRGLLDEVQRLFHRTFEAQLVAAGPRNVARVLPLGREHHRYLDEASPVRWPGGAPVLEAVPWDAGTTNGHDTDHAEIEHAVGEHA
jgi:hypothetical protein